MRRSCIVPLRRSWIERDRYRRRGGQDLRGADYDEGGGLLASVCSVEVGVVGVVRLVGLVALVEVVESAEAGRVADVSGAGRPASMVQSHGVVTLNPNSPATSYCCWPPPLNPV
jgi:hypothetical protein